LDRNCKGYSQNESNTTLETLFLIFKVSKEYRPHYRANPVVSITWKLRRLTREVRIQAKYDRSLEVLRYLKEKESNKSGIMLGLGEEEEGFSKR
jgi:lipoic acid synthetase